MKNQFLFSICILAGGQSKRMGCNKALMPFLGQPLIMRIVEQVIPLHGDTFIVANEPVLYKFTNLRVYEDEVKGIGVLGGLYTALNVANSPYVAILACDLPFVNPKLIKAELDLMGEGLADVVIPESKNGLEPLHALYRRDSCLLPIQRALANNQKRLVSWMDQVEVRVLTKEQTRSIDPFGIAFMNINTPQDLIEAEGIARNGVRINIPAKHDNQI